MSPGSRAQPPSECRCVCGSLVARLVPGGVELKCRRCKRVVVVPIAATARVPGAPPALPGPR